MCWLFDLSERMGWADGSHVGSWLRPLKASAAAGGGAGWEASEGPADLEMEEEVRQLGRVVLAAAMGARADCSLPAVLDVGCRLCCAVLCCVPRIQGTAPRTASAA